MLNIKLDNPSMEHYIQTLGKEKLEQMFLSFLEIKTTFNESKNRVKSSLDEANTEVARDMYRRRIKLNSILHNKILSLTPSSKTSEMSLVRDEISNRINEDPNNQSLENIRDEYYQSKGYL